MRRLGILLGLALLAAGLGASPLRADWTFVRGDTNADGQVNFVDVINLLNKLFVPGAPPPCRDALDVNDNGFLELADPIFLLQYIFEGGAPPRSPFPGCGLDPTTDSLGCAGPLTTCPEYATEVQFSIATQQVSESAGTLEVDVVLSTALPLSMTILFQTSGAAGEGSDYLPFTNQVIVPAGQLSATLVIPLIDDNIFEGDEDLTIVLTLPAYAQMGTIDLHTAMLMDDDPMPEVNFSGGPWSAQEGIAIVSLGVALSGPSAADVSFSVAASGAAQVGTDFLMPTTPVTIPAGTLSATITVPILDDSLYEGVEELILTLISPIGAVVGAGGTATVPIGDNDTPPLISFAVPTRAMAEASIPISISVFLGQAVGIPVTASLTVSGTATLGVDYLPPVATVTIPAGSTIGTFTLSPINDAFDELDETVLLTLENPTNAVLGTFSTLEVTIIDDDNAPFVSFPALGQSVGEAGGTILVPITLSAPSALDIEIPFTFTGSATVPGDAVVTVSPLAFPAGTTSGTITVAIVNDARWEPAENLQIVLGAPTNAFPGAITTYSIAIADDDPVPMVGFTAASSQVDETAGTHSVLLSLSSLSSQPVVVPLVISGTASIPDDASVPLSVTIAAGTLTTALVIAITDDGIFEGPETIDLALGTPSGGTLAGQTTHSVTIIDDEPTPTASFSTGLLSVGESAGSIDLTIALTIPSSGSVSIPFHFEGDATSGTDVTVSASPLALLPGETTATITVAVVDDNVTEPLDTLRIVLDPPTGAALGTPSFIDIQITDDDPLPVLSLATAGHSVSEGAGTTLVTILFDRPSASSVVMPYSISGSASAGTDFTVPASPLVIPPFTTTIDLLIDLVDDSGDETDEGITITLGAPTGATLGATTVHTVLVLDNDAPPLVTLIPVPGNSFIENAGNVSVTAQLSAPSVFPISVPFSITGQVIGFVDYIANSPPLDFAPGQTTASIGISLINDTLYEGSESMIITLGPPTNASLGSPSSLMLSLVDDDPPPAANFLQATSIVTEDGAAAQVVVTLDSPSAIASVLQWTLTGTASTGLDFVISPMQLIIPAGQTTALVSIAPVTDNIDEADETVTLTLANLIDATPGVASTHQVTIIDRNNPPTLSFQLAASSLVEGSGPAGVTWLLSGPSGNDLTIPFTVSGAAAGPDLTIDPSPLVIPAGQLSGQIGVVPLADAVDEPDQAVVITLGAITGATLGAISSHTITVVDANPTPTITLRTSTVSVTETGLPVSIIVDLSGLSDFAVTVPFTLGGTATIPGDATVTASPVTIAPGTTSAPIVVTPIDDLADEPDETVTITLGNPTNAGLGATTFATVTVIDDDLLPVLELGLATATIGEGGGSWLVPVTLSSPAVDPVTVPYSLGGDADPLTDLGAFGSQLVIPPGSSSATIAIPIADDSLDEPDELLTLALGTPTNATSGVTTTAQTTIIDNDAPSVVRFALASSIRAEGDATLVVNLLLTPVSGQDVVVPITLSGSATPGEDYIAPLSNVLIPAGSTTATLTIPLLDDVTFEGDETIQLVITAPSHATIGTPGTHLATITDDEPAPVLSFATASSSAAESAGTATVTILLDAATGIPVTATILTSGTATAGTDFTQSATSVTIAPGQSSATFAITLLDDLIDEDDETVSLTFGTVQGGVPGPPTTHLLSILDDEPLPAVSFATATRPDTPESAGSLTVDVLLGAPSGRTVTVPLVPGGSASLGADYTLDTTTVTFAPGQTVRTVSIVLIDDPAAESNETISLSLGAPLSATVGSPGTHSFTVLDDDGLPAVSFATAFSTAGEGMGLTQITATLTVPASVPVNVPLLISGTATLNIDYAIAPLVIHFDAGETAASVPVIVIDDLLSEDNETIVLTFGTPTGAVLGAITTRTIQILDDDPLPTVFLETPLIEVIEGAGPTSLGVFLDAPAGRDVIVSLSLSGSATEGVDLAAVPTTVVVPAGETEALISLIVTDDTSDEPVETFILVVDSASNAFTGIPEACELRIHDDDAPPAIAFVLPGQSAAEGALVSVEVGLTAPSGFTVTVPVLFGGSAETGVDYTPSTTTLSFPPGTAVATISLALTVDATFEGDETIDVSLGVPTNGVLGGGSVHTVSLGDGDSAPEVSFENVLFTITEGSGLVRLSLTLGGAAQADVIVPWTVAGSAQSGVDFVAAPNPVVIQAGATSANLTLIVIDDLLAEPTEGVTITLGTPIGAVLGALTQAQVTIVDNGDPAPEVGFLLAFQEIGEGSGTLGVQVVLSTPSGHDIVVPFTAAGTVTIGADLTLSPSPLVIPAGSLSAGIPVTLIDDLLDEADEELMLTLGTPSNAILGSAAAHTLRILDNEAAPALRFVATGQTIGEAGGAITIDLALDGISAAAVTVPILFAGSAVEGVDLLAVTDTVIFAPGETSASLSVTPIDDLQIEGDETFTLTFGPPTGAVLGSPNSHTVTITDDDVPPAVSFAAASGSVAENVGLIPIGLVLSNPTAGDVVVTISISGTATPSVDFGLAPNPLVIPGGATSADAQLFVLNDTLDEPDETLILTISAVSGGVLGTTTTRTITILDDADPSPTIQFAQATQALGEGSSGVSITVQLSVPSGFDLSIPVTVSGTASAGDFTLSPPSLAIPAGASFGLLTLIPSNDLLDEPDETVVIALGSTANAVIGPNAIHTATIIDDDAPPTIAFGASSLSVSEGAGSLPITLATSTVSGRDVTVPILVSGSATAGVDYVPLPLTVTIPAGQTAAVLSLDLIDDLLIEGDEVVILSLGLPTNAIGASPQVLSVTIVEDDQVPTVQFVSAGQTIAENGGSTTVTASIGTPAASDVVIPITFAGTAVHFTDYVATPTPLVIPAGQTTGTLSIILLDDSLAEADETAILGFGAISGGNPGAQSTHTITILDDGDAAPTVAFSIASQTVAEGTTAASVEVRLSVASGLPVTVPITTSGTATVGVDWSIAASQVTVPAGLTSAILPLTIIDDLLDEPNETIVLTLGVPTNATLGAITTQTVTLLDNDDAPTVSFATANSSADENSGGVSLSLVLSAVSAFEVSVPIVLGGTATSGIDYTSAPATVVIPSGQTQGLVTVTLTDDLNIEPDESVTLTLGSPIRATLAVPAAHTLTIVDNDMLPTVTFATTGQTVGENVGLVAISVLLSAPTGADVTIPIGRGGTATEGADYTLAPNPVVILAGQTSASVQLVVIDDPLSEPTETIQLTLGAPTNGTLGTASSHIVTVTDFGDAPPTVAFAQPSQSTVESPGTVLVQLFLTSAAGQDVVIPFTLGGTAQSGEDYTVASPPALIPAGQTTTTLVVTLVDDPRFELSETLTLTLGSPSGATLGTPTVHTITIANDDPAPSVQFATGSSFTGEGAGTAAVSIVLSAPAGIDISVPFTHGGTATASEDYSAPVSPVVIPKGSTSVQLSFPLVDDGFFESDETVVFTLGSPAPAILGTTTTHTLTIQDNEGVPQVSFVTSAQTVVEGNTLVSVQISQTVPTGVDVTIPYTVGGTATSGVDYALAPNPAVIPAGATSTTLSLVLIDDLLDEADETIIITLGNPLGAVLGSPAVRTITVTDNGDLAPTISFALAASSAAEGVGTATATVNLSVPSGRAITVPTTVAGTATPGVDHFIVPGPLTIPAGSLSASISVIVVDDLIDEADESVTIALGSPSSGTLGAPATHQLDILDNDDPPLVRFTTATTSISESAGSVAVTVSLGIVSGRAVSVPLTLGGTASAGGDYSAPVSPLVIPIGATTGTITIPLLDDLVFEGPETIVLTLGTPTFGTLGTPSTHTVQLSDDEQLPVVSFTQATSQVTEDDTTVTVEVTLSIPSNSVVTVPLTLGGTANSVLDYAIAAGPVVFPAGSTSALLTLIIHEDLLDETDEVITLALGTPGGALPGAIMVRSITIIDDDAPPSVSFLTPNATVLEASGLKTIQVGLSAPSGREIVVGWSVLGSATAGVDFQISQGSSTFPAGTLTQSFTIDVLGDSLDEANESVVLQLSPPANAVLGIPATYTLTILDDDPAPTVSFLTATSTHGEPAGTVLLTLQLSAPSGQDVLISTALSGTATQGSDYLFDGTSPLRIFAGQTSGFLVVQLINDVQIEMNETIVLTILPTNAGLGAITQHTLTILEDDIAPTVTFTTPTQSVPEGGGAATITIQLSEPTGIAVTIPYTIAGSADLGIDATVTPGPLVIPAGQTSGSVSVTILDDLLVESNETVQLTLSPPVNGVLGGSSIHTLVILDDETPPTVQFANSSASVTEAGAPATLTVTLSAASTLDVTVGYVLAGTAIAGVDFSITPQPIFFSAGQTSATVTITAIDDLIDEVLETATVTLETPSNASLGGLTVATITVTDNDAPPVVGFTSASQSGTEGAGPLVATVALSTPSGSDVTIPFTLSGSALAGTDVTVLASPVTIPAGQIQTTISMVPLLDGSDEADETLVITLGAPSGATLGLGVVHTLTILDGDPPPQVAFTQSASTAAEGAGSVTIGLTLSTASGNPITVPLTMGGSAFVGIDANLLTNPVLFPVGVTTATVTVDILQDLLHEASETFALTIGTPVNATVGAIGTHTISITDDDPLPVVSFDLTGQNAPEASGAATVTISLSAISGAPVTVPVSASGTATVGSDYAPPATSLTILAGTLSTSFTVAIIDDTIDEPAETITLSLGAPIGAQLGGLSTHVITIDDDDVPPSVRFVQASQLVSETGGSVLLQVELTSPAAQVVTVPISFFGTATVGTDYSVGTSLLTIPAGNTLVSLTVTILDDSLDEPGESIVAVLGTPIGAVLGSIPVQTVTILDDDPPRWSPSRPRRASPVRARARSRSPSPSPRRAPSPSRSPTPSAAPRPRWSTTGSMHHRSRSPPDRHRGRS